jgi:hypothetical protein
MHIPVWLLLAIWIGGTNRPPLSMMEKTDQIGWAILLVMLLVTVLALRTDN